MVAVLRIVASYRQAKKVMIGIRWTKLTSNSLQKVIVVNWRHSCALIFKIPDIFGTKSTSKCVIRFDLRQCWLRCHAFLVIPSTQTMSTEASDVRLARRIDPVDVTQVWWGKAVKLIRYFNVLICFLI